MNRASGQETRQPYHSSGPRIALAQLSCVEGAKQQNLVACRRAVERAARLEAALIVLPEMILTGFPPQKELMQLAERAHGADDEAFRDMAVQHGIAIVAGLPELNPDGGAVSNAMVVFDRRGEELARYHKTHLFDRERSAYQPGAALDGLFSYEGVRFGLLCCFDIEFPEAARTLALQGAQCILVSSANMLPWDAHHSLHIRARSLENHLFVAYANRAGSSPDFAYAGQSALIDPLGRVVCEAAPGEGVIVADLDLELIAQSREVFDYLRERRPGLYSA
jgi:predicted amidohydrolase